MMIVRPIFIYFTFILGLCLQSLATNGYASECSMDNNGEMITDKRPVSPFKSIDIYGVFDLDVEQGNGFGLEITCEQNLLADIVTEVKNNRLYIFVNRTICTGKGIQISVRAPEIESLNAAGANDISVSGIENQKMAIKLDGAGNFDISGNTKDFIVELSGATDLFAKNFHSETARITLTGAGDAHLYASKAMEINLSGVGDVIGYGNPGTVVRQISGVGNIILRKN